MKADGKLVKVFDLLYLNGNSLIEKSTSFRKKNMRGCLTEIKGRIEFAVEYRGKTAKDVRERMDEVMEARGEGLVIKHPASQYVLNGRNMDWIKVKPEYMVCPSRPPLRRTVLIAGKDNMGETVDVLVVGEWRRWRFDKPFIYALQLGIMGVGPAAAVFPLSFVRSSMTGARQPMTMRNPSRFHFSSASCSH
jgi:ATP-dependent DNA ligase